MLFVKNFTECQIKFKLLQYSQEQADADRAPATPGGWTSGVIGAASAAPAPVAPAPAAAATSAPAPATGAPAPATGAPAPATGAPAPAAPSRSGSIGTGRPSLAAGLSFAATPPRAGVAMPPPTQPGPFVASAPYYPTSGQATRGQASGPTLPVVTGGATSSPQQPAPGGTLPPLPAYPQPAAAPLPQTPAAPAARGVFQPTPTPAATHQAPAPFVPSIASLTAGPSYPRVSHRAVSPTGSDDDDDVVMETKTTSRTTITELANIAQQIIDNNTKTPEQLAKKGIVLEGQGADFTIGKDLTRVRVTHRLAGTDMVAILEVTDTNDNGTNVRTYEEFRQDDTRYSDKQDDLNKIKDFLTEVLRIAQAPVRASAASASARTTSAVATSAAAATTPSPQPPAAPRLLPPGPARRRSGAATPTTPAAASAPALTTEQAAEIAVGSLVISLNQGNDLTYFKNLLRFSWGGNVVSEDTSDTTTYDPLYKNYDKAKWKFAPPKLMPGDKTTPDQNKKLAIFSHLFKQAILDKIKALNTSEARDFILVYEKQVKMLGVRENGFFHPDDYNRARINMWHTTLYGTYSPAISSVMKLAEVLDIEPAQIHFVTTEHPYGKTSSVYYIVELAQNSVGTYASTLIETYINQQDVRKSFIGATSCIELNEEEALKITTADRPSANYAAASAPLPAAAPAPAVAPARAPAASSAPLPPAQGIAPSTPSAAASAPSPAAAPTITAAKSIQPLPMREQGKVAAGYTLGDRQAIGRTDRNGKSRNRANDLYGSTQHQQDAADTHVFWDAGVIEQYTAFYQELSTADRGAYLMPKEFQKRIIRDLQHVNTGGGAARGAGGQKFGCQVPCPAVADSINAWEACFSLFKVIAGPTNVYSGFGAWNPIGDVYNEGEGKRFISVAKVGVQFEKTGLLGDILCQTMPDEGFLNPDYVAGGAGILGKKFIDPNTDQPYKAIFDALGIKAKKATTLPQPELLRGNAEANNLRTRELLRRDSLDGLVLRLQKRDYSNNLSGPVHNLDVGNYYAIVKRQMKLELAAVDAQAALMGKKAHHHFTGAGLGFFSDWAKEAVSEIYMRAFRDAIIESTEQFPNIAKIDVCWVGNPPYDKPAIEQLFGPKWNNGNIGGIAISGGKIGVHDLKDDDGLIPSGTNGADNWAFISNENSYASLEAAMGLTSDITSTQSSIYNPHLLDHAHRVEVTPGRRVPTLLKTDIAAPKTKAEVMVALLEAPELAQSYLQLELNRLQAIGSTKPKFSHTCIELVEKGASIVKAAIVKWALEKSRFPVVRLQYKASDGSIKQENDWITFAAIITPGSPAQSIAINRHSGEMIGCVNAQGTLMGGARLLTNAEIITLCRTYSDIIGQYPGVESILEAELRTMAAAAPALTPAAAAPAMVAAHAAMAAPTAPTTPTQPAAPRTPGDGGTADIAARRAAQFAASSAGAGPAAAEPTTAKAIISYPAISDQAQAAYHISWQQQMVAGKDALSDLLTTISSCCDSEDALKIADLLTIVNFISTSQNQAGAQLSLDLRSLNFAALASNIIYNELPLYTRHALNELTYQTPNPATSTFGALYEARMKDLALVLHKLSKNPDLSPEDLSVIGNFNGHFGDIFSNTNNKKEEVEVSLAEYNRVPRNTISLYRAKNGEMCLKFSSKEERDAALNRFEICLVEDPTGAGRNFCTGPQYLPENNRFGITPCIVSGNKTSIFFPSYDTPGGEIGVNLGSKENKAALLQILNLEGAITRSGTGYYGPWQETSHTGKKPTANSPENSTLCKSFTSPTQDATLFFTAEGIMRPNATKSYRFCQDDSGEVVCVGLVTRPELVAAAAPAHAAAPPSAAGLTSRAVRTFGERGAVQLLSAQQGYNQGGDTTRNDIRKAISRGNLGTTPDTDTITGDTAKKLSILARLASQDIPYKAPAAARVASS